MMKKYKKIITTVLICVSLLCLLPLQAQITFFYKNNDQHAMQDTSIDCTLERIMLRIDSVDFEKFLRGIVESALVTGEAPAISEALFRCYEQILDDTKLVCLKDLQAAMPEFFEIIESYCQEYNIDLKAPRPSQNNGFIGPGNCSLSTVLSLLRQILDALNVCCTGGSSNFNITLTVIEAGFNSTFTLLNTLEKEIQGTFTLLTDINDTLTTCCAAIVVDFNSTFSILAAGFDGTFSSLVFVSSQSTATALMDLKDTLTTCCAMLQEDFQETWTILDGINPTSTIIKSLLPEFQFTWSILDAGFNDTFSALAACCNNITSEFQQTWSILDAGFNGTFSVISSIKGDPSGTFSVLADIQNTLINDFNGTWSILDAGFDGTFSAINSVINISCSDTFTEIEAGFQGTYSALDACCRNITSEFQQTWSILDTGFDSTFSILLDIRASISAVSGADITGIYTAIATGFNGTFSILADIKNTMTADFNGTFSVLSTLFPCFTTSVTAGGNITNSGYYCFGNDINGSFTITANNVVLDLNSHTLSNGGIFVLTGTYRTIKNGRLDNSNTGIVLTSNTDTTLSGLNITNATLTPAITFTGIHFDNTVNNVVIENCMIGFSSTNDNNLMIDGLTIQGATSFGMTFTNSTNLNMKNVGIFNTKAYGIALTNVVNDNLSNITIYNAANVGIIAFATTTGCMFENIAIKNGTINLGMNFTNALNCIFKNCSVVNINHPTAVVGIFVGSQQNNNILDSCSVKNVSTGQGTGIQVSSGNSIIKNCEVESLSAISNTANGILIDGNFCLCLNSRVSGITSTGGAGSGSALGFVFGGTFVQAFNCTADTISIATQTSNQAVGFSLSNSNINCYNCVASNISSPGLVAYGFIVQSGSNGCFIKNCSADNTTGRGFSAQNPAIMYECQAIHGTGAGPTDGFEVIQTTNTALVNCTAARNIGNGFSLPASNTDPVFHCFSTFNTSNNYVNALNVQVANTSNPNVLVGSNVQFP